MRYRKRPVEVDATPWDGTAEDATIVIDWILANGGTARYDDYSLPGEPVLKINTLEGLMIASPGDFIIRGIQGEFYPCKPDIFRDSYEEVSA